MHEKNDGFPLLYVRSHAARLPGSVVRDWLVRCKVALAASQGRLVLKVRSIDIRCCCLNLTATVAPWLTKSRLLPCAARLTYI
jgi:hypothetical protein